MSKQIQDAAFALGICFWIYGAILSAACKCVEFSYEHPWGACDFL